MYHLFYFTVDFLIIKVFSIFLIPEQYVQRTKTLWPLKDNATHHLKLLRNLYNSLFFLFQCDKIINYNNYLFIYCSVPQLERCTYRLDYRPSALVLTKSNKLTIETLLVIRPFIGLNHESVSIFKFTRLS